MNSIPLALRKKLEEDPFYSVCAKASYPDHTCKGKITWEHALYFGGKQVQERYAIIPLCEYGHSVNSHQDGGDLDKKFNEWVALHRATDNELTALSKAENKFHRRNYLDVTYGSQYNEQDAIVAYITGRNEPKQPQNQEKKKFWYPVSDELKLIIQKHIDSHKRIQDVHYTPFEMIEQMIRSYDFLE